MKKFIYLTLLITALPLCLLARQRSISGKVTDKQDDTPLSGVTIFYVTSEGRNSPAGTTNTNGSYSISIPSNAVQLVFSYTSMESLTENIQGRSVIDVKMAKTQSQLSDVIVVGYGTQKKQNVTGAITVVGGKDIVKNSNSDVTNTLTGRAPGVRVAQFSSQPGKFDTQIDIRGFSYTAPQGQNIEGLQTGGPLIIVDGVQRDKQGFDRLDPNEIESISILKDATASIYGVKAANGVILVTTKKGTSGKAKVTYTMHVGKQFVGRYPELSNGIQYATLFDEKDINNQISNRNQITTPRYTKEQLADFASGKTPYNDYLRLIMKDNSDQQQHNVTITGGGDRLRYFISGGYFREGGLLTSNMEYGKKYNLRTSLDGELFKGLNFGVNIALINSISNAPNGAIWNTLKNAWQYDPTEPLYANNNPQYLFHSPLGNWDHPLAQISQDLSGYSLTNDKFLTSTWYLNYTIPFVSGLSTKLLYAYDNNYSFNRSFRKQYNQYTYNTATQTYSPIVHNTPSQLSEYFAQGKTNDLQFSINYQGHFADHNISLLGLYEEVYRQSNNHNAQTQFVIDAIDQLAAGDRSKDQIGSGYGESANRSYVGKFNYDWHNELLAEFGFRYDGSSSFPANSRWGFFPYGSVGWRLSEMPFFKGHVKFINNLKIRASLGKSGDDGIQGGSYQWLTGYTYPSTAGGSSAGSVFGSGFVRGVDFKNSANPDITWYTSTTTDIGLEASFLNGLISVEADVFRRDRDGLLGNRVSTIPATYGVNLPRVNLNQDRTQGYEFVLGHRNKIGDLNYNVSANITYARTQNRYVEETPANSDMDYWRNRTSGRYNDVVWGYKVNGQFQNYDEIHKAPIQDGAGNRSLLPGDLNYVDVNGDNVIDGKDMVVIARGGNKPAIYFGMNIDLSWKNIDFSMLIQGASMYSVSYNDQLGRPFYFTYANPVSIYADRWHRADIFDPNSEWIPGRFPSTGQRQNYKDINTFSTFDASYARVKSIELGYSLPQSLIGKLKLSRVRAFLNAYNLFTFTGNGLKFVDPEYTDDRLYSYNYPITYNVNFGLQVSF